MAAGGGQFARSAQPGRHMMAPPARPLVDRDRPAANHRQRWRCAAGTLVSVIAHGASA
jgi:hypothetical protein